MSQIHSLSIAQLKEAVVIKEQIAKLQFRLAALTGDHSSAPAAAAGLPKGKGSFKRSPETLARMRAAQQARWAKIKGTATPKSPAKPAKAAKSKKGISAEGRAKLAAAMKARWAAKKQAATAAPAPAAKPVSGVKKFVKKY